MPLFDYECRNCGEKSELLIRSDEKPKCPACGSAKMTRQLSVPAAHTAGSSRSDAFNTPCGMPPGSCGGQCGLG